MAKPCPFLHCKIKSFHFLGLFFLVCYLTIQLQIALNELNSQMEFYTSFSKISSEEDSLSFRNTFESVRSVAARRLDVQKRESVGLVWRLDFTSPSFRYIVMFSVNLF